MDSIDLSHSNDLTHLLPGLHADAEAIALLTDLWRTLPALHHQTQTPPSVARALLTRIGDEASAWESPRLKAAREALELFVDGPSVRQTVSALINQAANNELTFALNFGGQGLLYLDELAGLTARSPAARSVVKTVNDRLASQVSSLPAPLEAVLEGGIELEHWLAEPSSRPNNTALARAPLSMALIFTTQAAQFVALLEGGYDTHAFYSHVAGAAGHSQGFVAAVFSSEVLGQSLSQIAIRAADYASVMLCMGLRAQQASPTEALSPAMLAEAHKSNVGEPSPMLAVTGLTADEVDSVIAKHKLSVVRGLANGLFRHVVCGSIVDLEHFRRATSATFDRLRKQRNVGKHGGRAPEVTFDYVGVSVPFHSPHLGSAVAHFEADVANLGFEVGTLRCPVIDGSTGETLLQVDASMLARRVLVDNVEWPAVAAAFAHAQETTVVLDFGPSDAGAKLLMSSLRGRGVHVLALATAAGQIAAFDANTPLHPEPRFADYGPTLATLPNGKAIADNRFTRFTGAPPIFLPGMTPTTVEAPIVVAASNAGYVAELAGGGQVTELMLRRRFDELASALHPGRGFVFNALYLDPYLWNLHFGAHGNTDNSLIVRLKNEGYPINGVTISAGIPPVDEATALLRSLVKCGIWQNALKPGNDKQLDQVLRIADASSDLTIIVQIEGGKAGGHHSWEDLDDLLVRHYASIRTRKNVILAVGGGIADEAQATAYVSGTWSEGRGLPPMPVDAVFLGTALMAVREACTSPAVKEALARAEGTTEWVLDGQVHGAVTSGRSQLDATIYYLDNAAAKAGRLLDSVAGNTDAIEARREEIIDALAKTAKPYFGDLEQMTYRAMLERFAALTAIGRHGEYDDGIWPDISYRRRFLDMLRASEARLHGGETPFASMVQDDRDLDDPRRVLVSFVDRYPSSSEIFVHPEDARFFVQLCRSPGKPVCFVPVIDVDVRRWYKSDSLWQAHHDGYTADQVLTIPGPAAVAGIGHANEPVAEVLERFSDHLVKVLSDQGTATRHLTCAGDRTSDPREDDRGPLAAAMRAHAAVTFGGRTVRNPLHALFCTHNGVRFEHVRTDGVLSAVIARDASGATCARIALGESTHGITQLKASIVSRSRCGKRELDLNLVLAWHELEGSSHLTWDRDAHLEAQVAFYGELLFDTTIDPVAPFEVARTVVELTEEAIITFARATSDDSRGLSDAVIPINMTFALAWEGLYRALAGARPDMLALLHEDNAIATGPGWPLRAGDAVSIESRIIAVEEGINERRIATRAELYKAGLLAATVDSRFYVRLPANGAPLGSERREPYSERIRLRSAAERAFLTKQPWLSVMGELPLDEVLTIDCPSFTETRGKETRWSAEGSVRLGSTLIASIALEAHEGREHPVRAACRLLSVGGEEVAIHDARALGEKRVQAPVRMTTYARAGGDHNPIHLDEGIAAYAGLSRTIVHGMWTASAAVHRTIRLAAAGDARRIAKAHTRFIAPLFPGETITVAVRQVGLLNGRSIVELEATTMRDGLAVLVLIGRAELLPPKTAYAFPGQGVQTPNMGMAGYARSSAARAVWDEADRICKRQLGFSLLEIVRDNPRDLVVGGDRLSHPKGVLFLTQFTQVAMAVMAVAQVRELEEQSAFVNDALFCGHSVGEYSALAAIPRTLPLAGVVELVYQRGLTMHRLVERDADGRSIYAMGVVRPHHAGLDEAGALALVARVATNVGLPLEIVNYNIRGRQYAVTGHIDALAALRDELEKARAAYKSAGKTGAPYLEVPGVDVPFHSRLLRPGVAAFRETLARVLPKHVSYDKLVDRYVPNLVARPFRLDRTFVECVCKETDSPLLAEVLASWDERSKHADELARTLLIELLAYQFASPVRWIETQDVLFASGSGVERFVEVGTGEQPTVANMARATLSASLDSFVHVLNSEANFTELLGPTAPVERDAAEIVADAATPLEPATPAEVYQVTQESAQAPTARVSDEAYSVRHGLIALLALQAKVLPLQVDQSETLDELFGGNSARRNQVLADIGAEFAIGAIDGAHEMPITELVKALTQRASRYDRPGKYVSSTIDATVARAFGSARLSRQDVVEYLSSAWHLGSGRAHAALCYVALDARDGTSARGGALSPLLPTEVRDRTSALVWLDHVVSHYARESGVSLSKASATVATSRSVDSAALVDLESRIIGANGMLARTSDFIAEQLGIAKDPGHRTPPESEGETAERLGHYTREHGAAYEAMIAPHFDASKHVAFTSSWAWAKRDVLQMSYRLLQGEAISDEEIARLAARLDADALASARALSSWHERQGRSSAAHAMSKLFVKITDSPTYRASFAPLAPTIHPDGEGMLRYEEEPRPGEADAGAFVRSTHGARQLRGHHSQAVHSVYTDVLEQLTREGITFAGKTALVTGAGPGSIGVAIVEALLHGGARVVVTTSTYGSERIAFFKEVYQRVAGVGAELHVVPMNQASTQDVDALIDWIFSPLAERAGAGERKLKSAWTVDFLVPFAATGELGDLGAMGERSLGTLRVLLLGVERLIARVAEAFDKHNIREKRCHVLLPLSPNHGLFGGDGAYAEGKAALEALLNKWRSEQRSWGRFVTLCGARIGWVRGTGLMDDNNVVAAGLERETGLRTFSTHEMACLLVALLHPDVRRLAVEEPLLAELAGGFERLHDLPERAARLRSEMVVRNAETHRVRELDNVLDELIRGKGSPVVTLSPKARPTLAPPIPDAAALAKLPMLDHLDLTRVVVIVGYGEVGPWGGSRSRWSIERSGTLSLEAAVELAWMMGFVKSNADGAGFVDIETDEAIDDVAIKAKYESRTIAHSGIRLLDASVVGFDPSAMQSFYDVHLDRDFSFPVPSREVGEEFVAHDELNNELFEEPSGTFIVRRKKGAVVRVARALRLDRQVAGQIPTGWDATRYGLPQSLVDQVDRVTLFNLVSTVEAFMAAGLEPEEIYEHLHPSKVGSTQSSGFGGMHKLRRMYRDLYAGATRQGDALQETLINVVSGYAIQSYLGSYGPMSFPVAACATAAISLGDAIDKILTGQATLMVAGGVDDYSQEGGVGFGDMAATASSDELEAMGVDPKHMSRPNDVRRRGFVESQGAGTQILCTAKFALDLGLPVYGIVAHASSHGDGVNLSVPAPGMGVLAAAAEDDALYGSVHTTCAFEDRRRQVLTVAERAKELAAIVGSQEAEQMVRLACRHHGHEFYKDRSDISPLRGALAVFGLGPDDIAVVSKHDTSTTMNDVNENRVHDLLQKKLGRAPHLPIAVISQKALTGHSKGAAAAWQLNGVLQAMADGIVPGNQSLDDVDATMRSFGVMTFSDKSMTTGENALRAALITSLGFGHVGAILCVVHPQFFFRMLSREQTLAYRARLADRMQRGTQRLLGVLSGRVPLVRRRTERPFDAKEGTLAHLEEEARMLTSASARLVGGTFCPKALV